MDAALELEDDIFFKDLSKQISLLIMDDDEDDDPIAYYPSVNLQAFTQSIHPPRQEAPLVDQRLHRQTSKNECKGTGVFIPLSSQTRRQNAKQGSRFITTFGNKSQRPIDHNSRGPPPRISYGNNVNNHPSSHLHHHYSVDHKRL